MQLKYKNLIAEINYIARTSCFYGEIINCKDLIIFQAEYKKDLNAAFQSAAEQYFEFLASMQIASKNKYKIKDNNEKLIKNQTTLSNVIRQEIYEQV